jgi:hypothetical protein
MSTPRLNALIKKLISPHDKTFETGLNEAVSLVKQGDEAGLEAIREAIISLSGQPDFTPYKPGKVVASRAEYSAAQGALLQLASRKEFLKDPSKTQKLIAAFKALNGAQEFAQLVSSVYHVGGSAEAHALLLLSNEMWSSVQLALKAASVWPSVGVLFDIDRLGSTPEEHVFYGNQARQIFMPHLDPRTVAPAMLWHGDTQKTLDGAEERRFCIAVTTKTPGALGTVITAFSRLTDVGLAPVEQRFSYHPVDVEFANGPSRAIYLEPLEVWMSIDEQAIAVLPRPLNEDIELCRRFGWRYRLK